MSTVFGWPLPLVLIAAGLIVFVIAWLFHWLLLVASVVLVAVGLYLLFASGIGGL
jgi:hypothetical protein